MIELNTIHNEDCVSGMRKMEDCSVDLIVTSPPYNIGIDYDVYDDNMAWADYLAWTKRWVSECYRVLKDDGRMCVNHYLNFQDRIEKKSRFPPHDIHLIEEEVGLNVHKLCIWPDVTRVKFTAWGSYLSASAPYINTPFEGVLISYKKQWKKATRGVSTIEKDMFREGVGGVWHLGTTRGKTKACFPEKLPEMCIKLLSYEGDVVLDPFVGSGTTAAVAKRLNRKYIGFEISPDYCQIARQRLDETFEQIKFAM